MKILYLCHIDWLWIKQRPQFLAEELAKKHHVDVFYQPSFRKHNLQKNYKATEVALSMNIKKLKKIPLKNRYKILFVINNFYQKIFIKKLIQKENYDFIYITHPEFYPLIKDLINKVIYDCMDDHSSFFGKNDSRASLYDFYEKKLCEAENVHILASSHSLEKKLSKYTQKNITIIRNGVKDSFVSNHLSAKVKMNNLKSKPKPKLIVSYIGTIADWFDFSMLSQASDKVEFHVYGPKEVNSSHFSGNIIYKGILEHDQIKSVALSSDALIMPFIVNKLIESVDPVKLYEYISFNKPIICCYYNEISRFSEFVHFYTDQHSFNGILNDLICSRLTLYDFDSAHDFLVGSTWSSRGGALNELLDNV
ncbi:hypothetical protein KV201_07085 [Shewanella sp. SR1]|uniref:hypothetical protein n=1 Tax=Shewanella sp. SR1 TaxID=2855505 RepID=UPI001CF260AC|nr:hypothetical protein [Shewanella sp. SR1]MCB2381939.1 hypothetical protein [Shewanella sp. SR1]